MSPIHDQSYRRYAGSTRAARQRLDGDCPHRHPDAPVAQVVPGACCSAAWIPFIARTVHIYVVTMYPTAGQVLPVDAKMFMQFVEQQGFFIFFVDRVRRLPD